MERTKGKGWVVCRLRPGPGDFARKLVELGQADAAARRIDLEAFLGSAEEQSPPGIGWAFGWVRESEERGR